MKKQYILWLFLSGVAVMQAQIVNIPDANFKAKLLSSGPSSQVARDENDVNLTIDTNNNGEIEFSETLPIRKLNLPGDEIANLTGIASFANLTHLNVNANNLTTLDVSMLPQLKNLMCISNELATLSVGPALETLLCSQNSLASLDVSGCSGLQTLHCNNNQLVTLDVSNKPNLNTLYCFQNLLTSLNISNSPDIYSIWCSDNSLSAIDLSDVTHLSWLECYNNQIISLDLSPIALPNWSIFYLNCSGNLLSTLDVSVVDGQVTADCSNNPNLTFINCIGTGTFYDPNAQEPPFPGLFFQNTPNLTHICADAVNFPYLESKITDYGYTGVTVDATCTLNKIDFSDSDHLKIYPNPVANVLNIRSNEEFRIVHIYNMIGQLMLSVENKAATESIDVSKIPSGNYLVEIHSETDVSRIKFIKQ